MITSDGLGIDRKREEGGENEVASVEKSIVVWRGTERDGVERRNQLKREVRQKFIVGFYKVGTIADFSVL
jgi:hypothetical protein